MLYFGKIQDDSYGIIAQISCIMPSFHKPNLTDIIGCVLVLTRHLFYNGAVPCSGSTSSRVKKRGKGHRLPSQAKYVIMSVRKFFEKEREKQKSILHDQIVKRTSAACGVGTATVVRSMKATRACCLVLKSNILLQEVQIVLDDFKR